METGLATELPNEAQHMRQVDEREQKLRRRLLKLHLQVDSEYQTWGDTQRDIIDFIQPNRGAFVQAETNRGDRKDDAVVNNTPAECSRKLTSAMDVGAQSEASEWFTLAPEDPLDAENEGVREYLHTCQAILFGLIARSNYYTASRNLIADVVGPGTGLMLIEEDEETVFRCTHVPIGSYRLWADAKGRVAGFSHQYTFTAAQMAEEFGIENCSLACQNALKSDIDQAAKFTVLHIVEKRRLRDVNKIDARNKLWGSYWLEIGAGTTGTGIATPSIYGQSDFNEPLGPAGLLRESGFDEQPFVAPRWNTIGQDAYGKDSPGWNSLGDAKALQALEMGGAKAIALMIQPPMGVPPSLKNASLLPGALWEKPDNSASTIEPILKIPPEAISVLRQEKQDLAARIDKTHYGDVLFLISNDEQMSREPKTAEEIRGIKEERLLQLGGAFSRYANESMKPGIGRMFSIAQRAGKFPPPPPELLKKGKIRVQFQNPLVTAQKTIGFSAMQQMVSFSLACAQAQAGGVDKIDFDEMQDTAADMLGLKPNLLKSDDELAQQRQARAQQQQAAQQGAAMTQAAPAIKDLSNSDPDKLRALVQQFGGNAVAQATA